MENYLLISDAAKEVQVESHVLRYWEEELRLPIRRNDLGHRYYTKEDVELFKQIKVMKERGLQLKAIKMILKDGKLDVVQDEMRFGEKPELQKTAKNEDDSMGISIIGSREISEVHMENKEEKARRLQWLLQQLMKEALRENNRELCDEIKESVIKELDYQFRVQEEREEERDKLREKRDEAHYQKLDQLLRKKSNGLKKKELWNADVDASDADSINDSGKDESDINESIANVKSSDGGRGDKKKRSKKSKKHEPLAVEHAANKRKRHFIF